MNFAKHINNIPKHIACTPTMTMRILELCLKIRRLATTLESVLNCRTTWKPFRAVVFYTLAFRRKITACVLIFALICGETAALSASPLRSHSDISMLAPAFSMQALLQEALLYFLKQKMGNVLPLQLDPSQALPTVPNDQLPGGPFRGLQLSLTAANVSRPLPAGDYEVPVMAYCTQYSVHRAGRGAPTVIAPLTGTQAKTIGDFLWRGTQAGKSPQELQTTAWAIQAGVPYSRMSRSSQQDIDAFIPGARGSLEQGFSIDAPLRTFYNEMVANPRKYILEYKHAKGIKFPPDIAIPNIKITAPSFDQLIAQAGPLGKAYVQAEADQQAILREIGDQQHQQENLLLHQAPTDPPMAPTQGPWTVRVPGHVYMRAITQGGNMKADNILQIRVVAGPANAENHFGQPRLIRASYQAPQAATAGPSVLALMGAPANLLSPEYTTPTPVRYPSPGSPVRDPISPTRDPIPIKPVQPPETFPGEPIPPGETLPTIEEGGEAVVGVAEGLDPAFYMILFSAIAAQALIIAIPRLERDVQILRNNQTQAKSKTNDQKCPGGLPTVIFRESYVPNIVAHIRDVQATHPEWVVLTKDSQSGKSTARRNLVCKELRKSPQTGYSCDEYPFASTLQGGGEGAKGKMVPIQEQSRQGYILGIDPSYPGKGFYAGKPDGTKFCVETTP